VSSAAPVLIAAGVMIGSLGCAALEDRRQNLLLRRRWGLAAVIAGI
jgi:hypothetical protein